MQLKKNVILQDKNSATLMENNGKVSYSKRSRHLNIRYFYVKDSVDKDKIEIVHCPTERMLSGFFTKPVQGALFKKFRAVILGHQPISIF